MQYKSIPLNENYEISPVILGEGRYGKVFLGKAEKQEVAVKYESIFQKEKLLANETQILKNLISKKSSSNVGIPTFYDYIETDDGNYMVIELLGQSLKEKQKVHKFSWEEIGKIGVDLLNTFNLSTNALMFMSMLNQRIFYLENLKKIRKNYTLWIMECQNVI